MDLHASIFVPGRRVARAHTGRGLLSGTSFAAKDLFDIEGHTPSAGHPRWAETHEPAPHDAKVIAQLRAAGGDLIGVTIMDELGFSLTGQNPHYGTPDNPRAPGLLCGGSSAGSAAAVAAGLCDFAIGTDTSGSIRIPASFCGLYGVRPTHGRVSAQGVVALAPSFDTVGWLARDGAVLCRVAEALLGDVRSAHMSLRLLVATDALSFMDAGPRELLGKKIALLAERLSLPVVPLELATSELEAWADVARRVQGREAWAVHGAWLTTYEPRLSPEIHERFELARTLAQTIPAGDIAAQEKQRAAIRARLEQLTADALVVLPAAPTTAPRRHATKEELARLRARTIPLVCLAGLSGLPQVVVPAAEHDGAPLGLSFLGPRGSDLGLVDFARQAGEVLSG